MSDPLRAWFVTMRFPVVSEAFAGVEVRALLRHGIDLKVCAIRGEAPGREGLLRSWRLEGLRLDVGGLRSLGPALLLTIAQPWKVLATIIWTWRAAWRRPLLWARCMALLPRMLELFRQAQRERPAVVHLFWGHYPAVFGHMLQRWLPETVLSISLGAYDLLYRFPPSVPVANAADCLWTHAAVNLPALRQMGVDVSRCRVLLRGVDLDQVPDRCLPKRGSTIVTAARLVREKGTHRVIDAFARVADDVPDACLIVLGSGPERARLEQVVREKGLVERVRFSGSVTHDEVYRELKSASVFMLLTTWPSERLPNVVKEAMACGCTCIVSDCPGILELMSGLQQPQIVPGGDPARAASLLRDVLASPALFETDRARGADYCRAHLDAMNVAAERIGAWREAVRHRSAMAEV